MKEMGIDISNHKSKSVQEFLGQQFDYVVTVCDNAKQKCPMFPGKYKQIHWDLENPAKVQGTDEEVMKAFRKTRDIIKQNINNFIAENVVQSH